MKIKKYALTGLAIGVIGLGSTYTISANMASKSVQNIENKTENKQEKFTPDFKIYVTNGTITQDTADQMIKFMETKKEEHDTIHKKLETMNETQKQEYFVNNPKIDLFTELVNQKILTQEQADIIKNDMPKKEKKQNKRMNSLNLSTYVSNGLITEEQNTNITAYLETKKAEHEAEHIKIEAMDETTRKAYFDTKKTEVRKDIFSDLVAQNLLTQEQATTIKNDMPKKEFRK